MCGQGVWGIVARSMLFLSYKFYVVKQYMNLNYKPNLK